MVAAVPTEAASEEEVVWAVATVPSEEAGASVVAAVSMEEAVSEELVVSAVTAVPSEEAVVQAGAVSAETRDREVVEQGLVAVAAAAVVALADHD